MKWDCEANRKVLGKGNQVSILVHDDNGANVAVEKAEVNKMLRLAGFQNGDILGLTKCDFNPNQIEIHFKEDTTVDTCDFEARLKSNGIDASVLKFDKIEEYLTIYGLPLTKNMLYMKNLITESVTAYVKDVISVNPMVYDDENGDDFFKGKFNGNWRVKVSPTPGRQVPNFIVVGPKERVMAKAVYSKNAGNKLEMCSDCFSTGHYKRSEQCVGPVRWEAYCKSFKEEWDMLYLEKQQVQVDAQSQDGDIDTSDFEVESRAKALEKALAVKVAAVERKEKELEERLSGSSDKGQPELEKRIADLNLISLEKDIEIQNIKEKANEASIKMNKKEEDLNLKVKNLEEKLVVSQNEYAGLMGKLTEDHVLVDKAHRRMSFHSQNVTVRSSNADGENDFLPDMERQFSVSPLFGFNYNPIEAVVLQEKYSNSIQEVVEDLENLESGQLVLEESVSTGFKEGTDDPEVEALDQLVLEESVSTGSEEGTGDPEVEALDLDESAFPDSEGLPGTPKRAREGESPSMDCSKVFRSDRHPDIGRKIGFETVKGKCEYSVESKKNKKDDDFSYVLINSESKKTEFDLKTVKWVYISDGDPLSIPQVEQDASTPIME